MYNKRLITALVVLIFLPGATTAIGKRVEPLAPDHIFSSSPIIDAKEQASIVLAQNDKSTTEESKKTESESVPGKSEAAVGDEKKSSEAESKPLKPFVPSEKIPGEQAVDFPVDI